MSFIKDRGHWLQPGSSTRGQRHPESDYHSKEPNRGCSLFR